MRFLQHRQALPRCKGLAFMVSASVLAVDGRMVKEAADERKKIEEADTEGEQTFWAGII